MLWAAMMTLPGAPACSNSNPAISTSDGIRSISLVRSNWMTFASPGARRIAAIFTNLTSLSAVVYGTRPRNVVAASPTFRATTIGLRDSPEAPRRRKPAPSSREDLPFCGAENCTVEEYPVLRSWTIARATSGPPVPECSMESAPMLLRESRLTSITRVSWGARSSVAESAWLVAEPIKRVVTVKDASEVFDNVTNACALADGSHQIPSKRAGPPLVISVSFSSKMRLWTSSTR